MLLVTNVLLLLLGYQCTTTNRWVWYYYDELSIEEKRGRRGTTTLNIFPVGRVLLRLNAFGYQCTTTKCVWYYYNWVYIGENSEYYYFKLLPIWYGTTTIECFWLQMYYYYLVTNVLLLIRNIFQYGMVLLRLNAFGYQCTTGKCVWYYYNWVYIGENSEYYYF